MLSSVYFQKERVGTSELIISYKLPSNFINYITSYIEPAELLLIVKGVNVTNEGKLIADQLARVIKSTGKIKIKHEAEAKATSELKPLITQLNHMIETINQNLGLDIPLIPGNNEFIATLNEVKDYICLLYTSPSPRDS